MIRPATAEDYPAIEVLVQSALPNYRWTVESMTSFDAERAPHCKLGYLLAEVEGEIVGVIRYAQWADMYHPQMFWVIVQVAPDFRRQGIGTKLYQALVTLLKPDNPIAFKSTMYEGKIDALTFTQSLGFVEYSRRIESELQVQSFDGAPYQARIQAVENTGIQIKSLAELANDPEGDTKLFNLQWSTELDVPIAEILTKPTLEQWRIEVIDNSALLPSASFIALDGDDYVGLTLTFATNEGECDVDFTGTLTQYRRRGIALALKVRAIEWVQAQGYTLMQTTNDAVNTGMIAINRMLGFNPRPSRIQIEKRFDE